MTGSGLSPARLLRLRDVMSRGVDSGQVPGLVAMVARRGEVHVTAAGTMEAAGGGAPVTRDAIFRIASVTKQITAAAAMILVEECRLRLDDPVDDLLPELASRRVLRHPGADLEDTVPARRPITLRDLLTFRMGLGAVMSSSGTYPIQQAMEQAGLSAGPAGPPFGTGEFIERLAGLPLVYQPGEKWMYHTSADVLGVLLARAAGEPLDEVLAGRLFGPLGMADTGFAVPQHELSRMPGAYQADPRTGALLPDERNDRALWAELPAFLSGGGGRGLASTADDLLVFCTMLLNKGRHGGRRILSRPAVEAMTTDQLTAEQKAENDLFFHGDSGWGFGVSVRTRRTGLAAPGQFGWTGGTGTRVYTDPAEELICILLTQRYMGSPLPSVFEDFFTCAYQAIDD
jgi:CubicO group peptidase (beta-lactamase class C family)